MIENSQAILPVDFHWKKNNHLFESTPVNIAVIDRTYTVVASNSMFISKFGKAQGLPCYKVYKRRSERCENCQAQKTFEDGRVRVTQEHGYDSKGEPTQYVAHVAPLYDDKGEIENIIEMSYDITVNETLKAEYDTLFERVPCSISVIDRELKIVRANQLLRQTFGEVENEYCYQVYKDRDSACPYCPAMKTFEDGEIHSSKHVGVTKEGDPTHYIVWSIPLKQKDDRLQHVLEMSLDVTETHHLAKRLLDESAFRRNITESALDALVAVDENGRVQVFNPAAEQLFSMQAKDVIGSEEKDRFFPEPFRRALVDGGSSISINEIMITDAKGFHIPVRVSGAVLKDEIGQVIGGAASYQDLREIKKLEQEKLEQERLAAVGETVAVIAHAIKNILVGIQGGMYKLKSGRRKASDELIEHGLQMLDRNFFRVTAMVRGLLDLSQNKQPAFEPIHLAVLLAELKVLFKEEAVRRGITFVVDKTADDLIVHADPEGLHTAMANMISNAMDACEGEENKASTIKLSVYEENEFLVLETRDTGAGMNKKTKEKLFHMFYTTKGANGSGLGLAVTQKIVQEHGGNIEVESEPGEGSRFRIMLDPHKLADRYVERKNSEKKIEYEVGAELWRQS